MQTERNKIERKKYVQGLRIICIFMIAFSHFAVEYIPNAATLFTEYPYRFILAPFSGKAGVAFFLLLAGYFAYSSICRGLAREDAGGEKYSAPKYILTRYFRYVVAAFLSAIMMYLANMVVNATGILNNPGMGSASLYGFYDPARVGILEVLSTPLLINSYTNGSLWFLAYLFLFNVALVLGTVLLRHSKKKQAVLFVVLSIFFVLVNQAWAAYGFVGVLYYHLEQKGSRLLTNLPRWQKIIYLLLAYALFHWPEGYHGVVGSLVFMPQYMLAAALVFAVLNNSRLFQRILSFGPLPKLGDISFEFYFLHVPFLVLVSPYLYVLFSPLPLVAQILLTLIITVLVLAFVGYLVNRFVTSPLNRWFSRFYVHIASLGNKIAATFRRPNYNPAIFFGILAVIVSALMYYVYMCCNHFPSFLGNFSYDYVAHTTVADRIFDGIRNEPNPLYQLAYTYPLYHISTKLLSMASGLSIDIAAAFVTSAFFVLTVLVIRHLFSLGNIGEHTQLRNKGFSQLRVDLLSIATVLAVNVYAPYFTGYMYHHIGSPNIWHSPTYLIMRPFCILAIFLFCYSYKQAKEQKPYLPALVGFGVMLLFSALAKPSLSIVLLPVAACYVIWLFFRSKGKTFRYSLLCLIAVIPTLVVSLIQLYFGQMESRMEGQVVMQKYPLEVSLVYLLFMVMLPLYVLVVKGYKKLMTTPVYSLAWLMVLVGWVEYMYSSFWDTFWGYGFAAFFLLGVSIYMLFIEGERSRAKEVAGYGILSVQVFWGIIYLASGVLGSPLIY